MKIDCNGNSSISNYSPSLFLFSPKKNPNCFLKKLMSQSVYVTSNKPAKAKADLFSCLITI